MINNKLVKHVHFNKDIVLFDYVETDEEKLKTTENDPVECNETDKNETVNECQTEIEIDANEISINSKKEKEDETDKTINSKFIADLNFRPPSQTKAYSEYMFRSKTSISTNDFIKSRSNSPQANFRFIKSNSAIFSSLAKENEQNKSEFNNLVLDLNEKSEIEPESKPIVEATNEKTANQPKVKKIEPFNNKNRAIKTAECKPNIRANNSKINTDKTVKITKSTENSTLNKLKKSSTQTIISSNKDETSKNGSNSCLSSDKAKNNLVTWSSIVNMTKTTQMRFDRIVNSNTITKPTRKVGLVRPLIPERKVSLTQNDQSLNKPKVSQIKATNPRVQASVLLKKNSFIIEDQNLKKKMLEAKP
jgi:hypothetical protein